MARTQVTTTYASTGYDAADKLCVRSSTGIVYVLSWSAATNGQMTMYKGNANPPTSFSGSAKSPPSGKRFDCVSIAITSGDIIGVVANVFDTAAHGPVHEARYYTYHTADAATNQDTWQIDEQIRVLSAKSGNLLEGTSIALDINNVPHVSIYDSVTNMGSNYSTLYYINKIGGSWNTAVELDGQANQISVTRPKMTLAKDSGGTVVPQVIGEYFVGVGSIEAFLGNALNATTFSSHLPISDPSDDFSIACDSGQNTTYIGGWLGNPKRWRLWSHTNSSSWTTGWSDDIITTTGHAGNPVAVSSIGRVMIGTVSSNGTIDAWLNSGATWSGPTTIESTASVTYGRSKVKWAFYNDNNAGTSIDYIFIDATNNILYWNTHTPATPTPYLVKDGQPIAQPYIVPPQIVSV